MTGQKVVVVTGANRGIGLAICQSILQNHSPVNLYACSRAGKDLNLSSTSSNSDKSNSITYPKLDVTDKSSIQTLASEIKSKHGHLDILINNAGVNADANATKSTDNPAQTEEVIKVNYYGTLAMCQTFIPLLSKSSAGRIVNISSVGSLTEKYSSEIRSRFKDPNITLQDIDSMYDDYCAALRTSDVGGWHDAKGYCFSKSCINAMTGVLARENTGLVVNCCCPGWVDTDMGRMVGSPSKTPEQGAKIPVKLAFGDLGGQSGEYWSNPSVSGTGSGQVAQW